MSNMRVLSVGTLTATGPDNRPIQATNVSLEVTPAEAERLALATSAGRIQLSLRGYGDPDSIRTDGRQFRGRARTASDGARGQNDPRP